MGIGGNFWDLLKPYARLEGVDFLRNKRVAVDLSFWIVQHCAAIHARSPRALSPHLRLIFFRTIALFSKLGAFPVFVIDGEPSPLKDQARMERFLRGSCLEFAVLSKPSVTTVGDAPATKQRNHVFTKYVQECVELLQILGMPVLKAQSEAEALCAQLSIECHVDACITSDSDAFLFGAKCVIKCLRTNSKEPYECYYLSDIQAGLGVKRKQMIAIALLVGNDHCMNGVSGFGVETALRFVKLFSDEEVLERLSEVSEGIIPAFPGDVGSSMDHADEPTFNGGLSCARSSHCSHCGHPGNKKAHLQVACEYCGNNGSEICIMKSTGFKCNCHECNKDRIAKERRKQENWLIKACKKISAEQNFPDKDIINIYLTVNHWHESAIHSLPFKWDKVNVEDLVDYLTFHLHWEPSYIRKHALPMLSTTFLRAMASRPEEVLLLYDQYKFHSIKGVKTRHGHPYYLVKWKKAIYSLENNAHYLINENSNSDLDDESMDVADEPDVPTILVDEGGCFLVTEENMELVQAAFPKAAAKFCEEKQSKEKRKSLKPKSDKNESPKSSRVQLSITEFYRSTKPAPHGTQKDVQGESSSPRSKKRPANLDQEIPKSVRRRLLFD
ncbi:hypothetical protein HPP92_004956 [Vanilla planifolia]|uniref:Flap endonuclease GEN-like 1 n=1 Tax=Vanilla planifolia TaxID=51239 RepID=A0A835VBP5_VANPL|nr:hypothetical protein HPP92_004956 [Vanilla planifolia]